MQYRKLGQSDVSVSEISLGCWTLGGLNWVDGVANGWANVDEAETMRAVDYAIDQGVNHFDNADVYGNGRAERLLNKALGSRNKDVIIASKVGHFRGTAAHAYEKAHIRHQLEQSLINLGREYIDIYYFHHGDFGENAEYLDEAVETMHRLRDEGKVRLIGQSAYSAADFERAVPRVRPDVLQSWAHADDTQFITPGSPVRTLLDDGKMSYVAFSPLGQGRLLGKYKASSPPSFEPGDHRRGNKSFQPEALAKLELKLDRLRERFGGSLEDLARVALQYLLAFPCVGCVIPGFRNLQQVRVNLAAMDAPLTAEEVSYVREVMAK